MPEQWLLLPWRSASKPEISPWMPISAAVSQQCLCMITDPVGLDMGPGSDLRASVPTHPWPVPWDGWGTGAGLGHTALKLWPCEETGESQGDANLCRALTEIYCLFHQKKEITFCKAEDKQRTIN